MGRGYVDFGHLSSLHICASSICQCCRANEQNNRGTHLRLSIRPDQRDYDRRAQLLLWAYRTLPHTTTKISPAMLMFGRPIGVPADLQYGVPFDHLIKKCSSEYVQELRERLLDLHEQARQNMEESSMEAKRRYDLKAKAPDFQVGDIVCVYNPQKKLIA